MEITLTQFQGAPCAQLAGELTVFTVADAQDDLFGLLNHPRCAVDLAGVTELDGCGAQLLAILNLEAERSGRALRLLNADAAAQQALRLMGLGAAISLTN